MGSEVDGVEHGRNGIGEINNETILIGEMEDKAKNSGS